MRTVIGMCLVAYVAATCAVPDSAGSGTESDKLSEKQVRECYYRSYRYERAQNYPDAIKALLILHKTYPQAYTLNLRLAWLHYLNGSYVSAEKYYKTAITAAPNSLEAKLGYTLPLLAQARYKEVEAVTKQIVEVDPGNYYANLRLAIALRMQRKYDQAEQVVNRMALHYPTDVSFLTELGLLRVAQSDAEAAKRVFNDLLTLDPENVTAKYQLSKL